MEIIDGCSGYSPNDNLLMDVGGNALAMPVILSIFVSMYIHVNFDQPAASNEVTNGAAPSILDFMSDD